MLFRSGVAFSGALALGGGWMASGDFYTQAPSEVPRTRASVNAGLVAGLLEGSLSLGLFRASAGMDLAVPFGQHHVALTGERELRVRPTFFGGVGVTWAQVVAGYQLPYHPVVGAHLTAPAWKGLEVTGSALVGIPGTLRREDGSTYDTLPTVTAWVGLGYRFGSAP